MNDMEKCFYEPAELSVVDEGKGRSLVKAKGSPYKLGFLVAQGADGIFKSLNDAEAVDAMERAIVSTIRIMAMRRKAEFEKGTDAFDMSGGFNAVRDESALKEILKSRVPSRGTQQEARRNKTADCRTAGRRAEDRTFCPPAVARMGRMGQ